MALLQHADCGADLAGRAVAALESVVLNEGLLHRVQAANGAQALDGGDFRPVLHHREHEAAVDALAVEQHRARPALPMVAALLRTGELQPLAEEVEERLPRLHLQRPRLPVDRQGDRYARVARREVQRCGAHEAGSLTLCDWSSVTPFCCARRWAIAS